MAVNRVLQVLFFLQSVALLGLIMHWSRNCDSCVILKTAMINQATGNMYSKATSVPFASTERGQLSNCTLNDILQRPGVVMLTITNLGFLDMTMNMLASVRRVGICVNTTIIAEDEKVYKYLHKKAKGDPAVHVAMTNSGLMQPGEVKRKNARTYFDLLKKRQGYFLSLLEQGFEVLFTDSDTFWFRDPFPYFQGDFDMSMMDTNSPYPTRTSRAQHCSGFIYMKPTDVTLLFVKEWIRSLKGKHIMDQIVMNKLLQADQPVHVNIKPLDIKLFPPGPTFYEFLAKNASYSAVVMHAATIHGHDEKVQKFKSSNMWLVNASSDELVAREQSLYVGPYTSN
ncbi:UDP-D-xylose:L-fucose alpha-1,3-D-xylosyltransferase 3-like [Patiria miniata]|uniref:Nucleotide-diphospho-sugar transferase domain-containing protein n=1 Tax=Patiria miniata TaxID=46514 RepID=A0A913YX98_PATMI|nr:UDP-D-xylose:L-fucose alpha-1,3-D-xylosyltransferase 3-like [Patiria miniata]